METRQDRLVTFWLILALILFIYFIIPIRDDSHGNIYFSWSGFTNQTFEHGYEQTIWMSLYHIYIVLAGCALVVIAKRALGLARSIGYLSIGTVGLLGAEWLDSVSACLMALTISFSVGAVLAGIQYRYIRRDSVPGWKYLTIDKVWFTALILILNTISIALSPTDSPHFIALLIQYVGIAVLAFGFIGIIDSGSSEGSARMKLSKVVVTSWFCVNLLIALFLQHANEFPSEIPLVFQYFRVVSYSLGSFMAITIGMTDLLRIRLLGKEPETAATGRIQGTTP